MLKKNGYQAMITQHSWMFLSSYEKLRRKIQRLTIVNMVHLGTRAFDEIGGEVVQTTSFIINNSIFNAYKPNIDDLSACMILTYASSTLKATVPEAMRSYILKKRNDVVVFIRNIMDNVNSQDAYDKLVERIDKSLRFVTRIQDGLKKDVEKKKDSSLQMSDIFACDAFAGLDDIIIDWALERLNDEILDAQIDGLNIAQVADQRMSKAYHYSERYKNEYTTIKYAYLMMKSVSLMEFSSDIKTLVTNYQKESYLIDSYYRWFYYAYDQIEDNSKFSDVRQRVVETLQKTSSLFDPFPPEMGTDTAFLDRFHAYIPGWEIPKYRPDSFTNDYGFITDYLSEFMRELRKDNYSNIAEKYFKLGNNLNQRDAIAVRKLISGFIKLIYPDGEVSKDEVAEIMDISLELRRRVKEQLKKIGGMEFYDVNFSYIDNDSFDEHFVSVPEQGGGKMIPEGMGKPGCLYTVSKSKSGMIGCYRLETQMMPGNGKLTCTGIGSGKEPKEATNTAFNYLKANGNAISGNISTTTKDYIINYQDMQGLGMTGNLALPTLIAISSEALSKPPISSLAVLGEISIGGTLIKVEDLASTLQVCLDSGAKKVLLPMTSAADLGTVPADLVGAFSLIFYSSPEEAVYKALGVE